MVYKPTDLICSSLSLRSRVHYFANCVPGFGESSPNVGANEMNTLGAFTLLTSRFLKSRHFDPIIYTCAKNREVSVSRNFAIFWLVVRMCDHRLQCMHSCMQRMQYA